MRLKSPLNWFGCKGHLARHIVPLLPAHDLYVEPFAGGAQVFFQKPPSAVEVLNDLDEGLIGFFRVLRDRQLFGAFERLCALTPYSRAEWRACRAQWASYTDPVVRAWAWFVVARQSFSGQWGTSWSSARHFSRGGTSYAAYQWLHAIDGLAAVHGRLQHAQIECAPALQILAHYDSPTTLFYCDPPYVASLRGRGHYQHEMTDADHRALVAALLRLQGQVLISGYRHPLYTPLEEAGWGRVEFQTFSFATGHTAKLNGLGKGTASRRTEHLWLSPNCRRQQIAMFDLPARVTFVSAP